MPISEESKYKVRGRKGSGMETDQAEWLDMLLHQSMNILDENCNTEETNTSTISK